ncbi:MAG: conjugal transfer protein TraA [Rheinheimera sp.]|uniref:Conjugal transfer protein TraA n=3 Tax=Gammaproteobacteria TaxID=1236 RepID=A0AAD0U348_9GAMM|nr:conjugal transfer protein TraA [Pseudoalteromonas agarivorans]MAD73759.1 conjugal transfer protein TraA [Rheinheimera sp.]RCS68654.1 conjugal transfer protein TraA [Vibrio casei]SJN16044.1 Conjugative transfer protein TraA [Vibrio casei]
MNIMQTARNLSKNQLFVAFGLIALAVFLSSNAYAGSGGAEFDDVWSTLREWTEGTLGRIVAGAMILVGIIGGIARQSLMAFAMGVAGGMGLYNTPTIIETIMSATLEKAAAVTPAVVQLSNGLGG